MTRELDGKPQQRFTRGDYQKGSDRSRAGERPDTPAGRAEDGNNTHAAPLYRISTMLYHRGCEVADTETGARPWPKSPGRRDGHAQGTHYRRSTTMAGVIIALAVALVLARLAEFLVLGFGTV
jgi:hypothetical protein